MHNDNDVKAEHTEVPTASHGGRVVRGTSVWGVVGTVQRMVSVKTPNIIFNRACGHIARITVVLVLKVGLTQPRGPTHSWWSCHASGTC